MGCISSSPFLAHGPRTDDLDKTVCDKWVPIVAGPMYDGAGNRIFSDAYKKARAEADEHAQKMKQCFSQAHSEYEDNHKGEAKHLSDDGKKHQHDMEAANARAVLELIKAQNLDVNDTIDLHGLYVKEAVAETKRFVENSAKLKKYSRVMVITGQGHHSKTPEHSVVKDAILQLAKESKWSIVQEANNPGKFIVSI